MNPRNPTPYALAFLASLILACVGMVASAHADYTDPHPCGHGYVVQYEDDYCFTWSRMGNRRRGVYVGSHSTLHVVVVTPCQYSRMERAGRINWDRTPLLRGDMWALYYGCR